MKSVDAHLADCLAGVQPLPAREVPLLDALACVLAEDVASALDLPPFANSAMDGYAVRMSDVAGASEQQPVELPVVGDIPAGSGQEVPLPPGTAVRIMTGAPLPAEAEAVVPVEWTDRGTERVRIRQAPEPGQYLRPAGADVRSGQLVLRAGVRLTARHLGLLAAIGRGRVSVRPRPRVAVLATGNELVEPGQPLGRGQIHDSNGYALTAAARELGALAQHLGRVADDRDQMLAALHAAADGADLVITSGGVSAGAYDTVKEVLAELGTVRFDKVAMQPGMPQGFGTLGERAVPIFTLPGNPVSSMVSFEVFVRPVLGRLCGWPEADLQRAAVPAIASEGWTSPAGKRQFVRARLEHAADGTVRVALAGGQQSHMLAALAEASCLAVVPEEVSQVNAGDTLLCLPLDRGPR